MRNDQMRLLDNKLYLTLKLLVECGVKENTVLTAKSRGSNSWEFMDDPEDNRRILVSFEKLTDNYKQLVLQRFGNPYEHVIRQPILNLVINDHKAVDFFKTYRYDDGAEFLDLQTVNKYVRADAWLNALNNVDRQTIKKTFNVSVADFYLHAGELVALEKVRGKDKAYYGIDQLPGDFPSSYQRLMTKAADYKKVRKEQGADAGYLSLIDRVVRMTGNKISSKLGAVTATGTPAEQVVLPKKLCIDAPQTAGNELILAPETQNKGGAFDPDLYNVQMAVILYCCGLANNLNAAQVATISNTLFQANNWKTVSRHTILRIMKENKHLITAPRRGKREFLNSMGMQNKRTGPKWPMLYVTLDGWTVELVYQDYEPGKGTTYDNRLVVVVVLDPCDKYPLGYAIGERETPALIQEACRNAIIHTKELFGEALQPLQVQSDRYAIKKMTPFYQAMAGKYYTPAEAHNAKSKVIEPYFNYLNTNYCQLQCANWSGHNVDAKKENQVNREFLNMNKKNFPDRNGVIKQIDGIIAQERAIKQAKYLAKWVEAPADTKMPVGVADYLMMFGEELGTRTNKITGQGIIKEIDGMERTYDTFDPEFRKNMHLDWKLKGDKDNLTCVLALSPDERLRFVLEEKRVLPMDLYSTTQEDVDSRLRVKKFNKDWMAEITEINGRNADTVRELIADLPVGALDDRAEANLKLMFTNSQGQQKEGIQDAKRLGKAKKQIAIQEAKEVAQDEANWQDKHFAFIDQEVDTAAYQNL